jgi:hypothetical protein
VPLGQMTEVESPMGHLYQSVTVSEPEVHEDNMKSQLQITATMVEL